MICAEEDLLNRAHELGRSMEGMTIYSTLFPCPKCAKLIVEAHVCQVISLAHRKKKNGVFKDSYKTSAAIFDTAKITYNAGPPDNQLGRVTS